MNELAQKIIADAKLNPYIESPLLMAGTARETLTALFRSLGYKVGAEIGVKRGSYSKHLCKFVPNLKLYAIDPWLDYPDYPSHNGQAYKDRIYEDAKAALAPYNCEIIRAMSAEAAEQFEANSLDFVYIDGNHSYQYARHDIELWSRIVRPGGIVAGDDYINLQYKNTNCRVKQAVDEWTTEHEIKPWFVMVGGVHPIWFWVKE